MPSSVSHIAVTATIDTPIANVDTYAVSFETLYTLDTANIVDIQSFVFNNKALDAHQQSVVKVVNGSCKLLQTNATLDATVPKNIDNTVHTYLVTLLDKGTTSDALNHTMKSVIKI